MPGVGVLKDVLYLSVLEPRLDQAPERRVIEVVDVAVDLPPPEVVLECFERGVLHYSGVEGGQLLIRHMSLGEVLRPVEYIGRRECRHHASLDLVDAAAEELCVFGQGEGVLVRLAVRQEDVGEAVANMQGGLVHEIDRAHVVGFLEAVSCTELGKAPALQYRRMLTSMRMSK